MLKILNRVGAILKIKFMQKILNFIDPFLSYIDNGKLFRKPFRWLYFALAAINALLPFYILYAAIDKDVFGAPAKFVFAFILIWIFVLAAAWVGFQIWWNRSEKVLETSVEGAEFPATPVIAHFIQTLGEWLGSFIAIVGFGFALVAWIFLGDEAYFLSRAIGLEFLDAGILAMILFPIYGFLIIVVSRFIAESFRALAAIANNTKK
jgi:hypothetical protein